MTVEGIEPNTVGLIYVELSSDFKRIVDIE